MGAKETFIALLWRGKRKLPESQELLSENTLVFSWAEKIYVFDMTKIKIDYNTDIFLQDPGANWTVRCRLSNTIGPQFNVMHKPTLVTTIPESAEIYVVELAGETQRKRYEKERERIREYLGQPYRRFM